MEQKAIYKITNLLNNKVYIGQSIHPNRRWTEHKQKARHGQDKFPIHLAINKYGEENFTFEIIEWTEDFNNEEKRLIKELNTICPNGYNVGEGGENYVMYGENNPKNITPSNVVPLIIQDLKENKLSDRQIAKKYNLTDKIIADINHGYSHKQKNEQYPIRIKKGLQKLTLEQVDEIKKILETSMISYQELANKYNVSKSTIANINKGLTFKEDRIYPIRSIHRKN